jgi:hypothetical protein
MKQQPSNATNQDIYEAINDLRKELVTRDEMLEDKVDKTYLRIAVYEASIDPIRRFVFGLIAIAGAAFITALMALVLKK